MAEKNEVALTFSEQLNDKLISVKDALPKDFNRERFVQNALAVINEKPELAKVNKGQLQLGLLKGALLNLDFANREFYLIPYGATIQFQIDYRGMQKVAKTFSVRPIKEIYAKCVREGDEFSYKIEGKDQIVNFVPKPFNNADIVGCFCVVEYKDGGTYVETMSTEEINKIRDNYSKAKNSKAWSVSWDRMAVKSVIRRVLHGIELDFTSMDARNAWDEDSDANFIKKERSGEVVDVFTVPDVEVESKVVEPETTESDDSGESK